MEKRKPVYKKIPRNGKNGITNLTEYRYKKGVYFIYENGKLVYIGSSASDLYKTISRHFQNWKDTRQLRRISYRQKLGKKSYTFSVKLMPRHSKKGIEKEEYKLVNKYTPRDNKLDLYCNITGSDCESKVSKAKELVQKKKKKKVSKVKIKKDDLIDDVPF
ncbi:GIY-YIG nuclease family protein [Aureispira sp. CCB-QB1]|uniref:GIY-YIG nuclease family protein n=1 Tax=Aureispira sp. CCB-QB1 TaxID=1313421 RepID=UPI000696768D|nr:GIY-YIG nuclease family protein [Aureispira sp. CCB-QB1]